MYCCSFGRVLAWSVDNPTGPFCFRCDCQQGEKWSNIFPMIKRGSSKWSLNEVTSTKEDKQTLEERIVLALENNDKKELEELRKLHKVQMLLVWEKWKKGKNGQV